MYVRAGNELQYAMAGFIANLGLRTCAQASVAIFQKPSVRSASFEASRAPTYASIANSASPAFLKAFFAAKPLTAVAGASSTRNNIGRALLTKLQKQRLPHFAISDKEIPGVETFSSEAAPTPDILLIATPARAVPALLARFPETAKIVYSAGFEDVGLYKLQGRNFVGPNSVGVVGCNDFTFLESVFDKTKRFGVISHSGAILGLLARRGGCGFSVGNGSVLCHSDCVGELAARFTRVGIYCEKDDEKILDELRKHHNTRFFVLFGGTTELGAARASAHTGNSLSKQFIYQMAALPNVHQVASYAYLEAACALSFDRAIPVVQSGFCATAAADRLPHTAPNERVKNEIKACLAAENVPIKYNAVVDVTPSLSAAGIIRICSAVLRESTDGLVLSILGDLPQKNDVLRGMTGLRQYADRIAISIEGDLATAAGFEKLGFIVFNGIEQCCDAIAPLLNP